MTAPSESAGSESSRLANEAQRRATGPGHSAWVEANAGTGKTKVLTDRVTRLLLDGVAPQRILCLTFTKAAAAEMRNRLSTQLGQWALLDDAELDAAIGKMIDRAPEPAERILARRLFARVLDAPGGINILTIHAFCQSLLKRFPLEAGVAPGFEVLDEGDAETLLKRAENDQMEALARSDAPPALREALAIVAQCVALAEYTELMEKLLGERAWLVSRFADEAGWARERARLAQALGCDPGDKAAAIRASACADGAFDAAGLRRAMAALATSGKNDKASSDTLARWLATPEERQAMLDDYCSIFFIGSGAPRKSVAGKPAVKEMPDIERVLRGEGERIAVALDRAKGADLVDRTMALARLGLDIVERYARAKRRRGALDYDDLIVATRHLLEGDGAAAWVLYKLDGGIDHVLVDEAQDTNPDQWEVIRRLTEEFFVGETSVDRNRTIFAVGDRKQSIFSFQRADPRKLADMHRWFDERSQQAHKSLERVELNVSFRSTAAVLDAVDWVFAREAAAEGVTTAGEVVRHRPNRVGQPGLVELWPIVGADKSETDTTDVAAETDTQTAPYARLARLIAVHARGLIGRERRAATGALLNPGDFMVLVRRRDKLVTALVRELKSQDIAVAGVDRLNLGEELAIQDLLALARFVLLPHDDLNLACLLKSPLVGLDEEALFELAYGRKGHLWRALRGRAGDARFAAAHARLAGWLARADFTTPFDFFASALGPEGGRARLLERLGRQATDPIDELLSRALQYQHAEAPSLQGFLRWFEAGGGEIKRDLDQNRRREVRILTVHAAKGLQAPIVYLPDTTRTPTARERILAGEDGGTRLWLPRSEDANEAALQWRDRQRAGVLEEQNRLLYVAMTRAEDRLYVAGWVGSKPPDKECWHGRIADGLAASVAEAMSPRDGGQPHVRACVRDFDFTAELGEEGWSGTGYELVGDGEIEIPRQAELPLRKEAGLPPWWRTPASAEPDSPVPLAPSQPLPDEAASEPVAFSPLSPDDGYRWKRGLLIHELLQHLPALPAAQRPAAARRFLARPARGLTTEQVEQWADEALAVTEAPGHAALFAEGSRAEVPLIGTVTTATRSFTVSGQIDRLAIGKSEILIVDYKTNRPPPDDVASVPLAYRRQLALYRAILTKLYPGRRVRAYLLWTAATRLMEIDEKTLDKSMPYD